MQLLPDFVYTFRNFINVYKQKKKNETLPFTRVIVSPLLIGQDNFWRPNLVIANSVDKLMEMGHTSYRVRIEMNGTHEWLVGAISKTACSVDVTYYPFDRQTCSVILTSWGYTPSQVCVLLYKHGCKGVPYDHNYDFFIYTQLMYETNSDFM